MIILYCIFVTGSENLQCDNSVFLLQVQRIYSVIILVNVNVNQGLLEINVIGVRAIIMILDHMAVSKYLWTKPINYLLDNCTVVPLLSGQISDAQR